MLYSIPTKDLKYSDIISFITQNHREGAGLDYKEAIPKGLEKTIGAMANTFGGTIIVGIKDSDGFPDPASKGIPIEIGLEERVIRIAVDNIAPTIVPEVAVCSDGELCFVVIRIPQGRDTPYAVRKNQIYVRTGSVNTIDELASLDRIEWLSDGRRRSAEMRKSILGAMANRARGRGLIQGVEIPFGIVSMSFGPTHPHEPLLPDQEMANMRDQAGIFGYEGMSFPSTAARVRTVQGGVSFYEHSKTSNDFNYLEINRFGFLYFIEDMGIQRKERDERGELKVVEHKFEPFRIIRAADLLVNCAKKFYALGEYRGDLRLTVQADKLLKVPVHPYPHANRWMMGRDPEVSVDDQLLWFQDWTISELNTYDTRKAKLLELGKEVTFAFGFSDEGRYVEDMLNRYSPKA